MNTRIFNKIILATLVTTLAINSTSTAKTVFSPTRCGEWAVRATLATVFAWYFTNSHDWKGVIPNRTDTSKQGDKKVYLNQILQSSEYDTQEKWDSICQWVMQNRKDLTFMAGTPYVLHSVKSHLCSFLSALDPRNILVEEEELPYSPKC